MFQKEGAGGGGVSCRRTYAYFVKEKRTNILMLLTIKLLELKRLSGHLLELYCQMYNSAL